MERDALFEMENVSKTFGKIKALDGVSFSIPAGRIVGLVGLNGSGKTTLLRHAVGLCQPNSGESRTLGVKSSELSEATLKYVGMVQQEDPLVEWLTGGQLVRLSKLYHSQWDEKLEASLVERFSIKLDRRIKEMSPGERQKLTILLAVAYHPKFLILDEPASALDPIARAEFLELLVELIQDSNISIIISSHLLSDLERVVDHLLILKQGKLVCNKGLDELKDSYSKVIISNSLSSAAIDSLAAGDGILDVKRKEGSTTIICQSSLIDELKKLSSQNGTVAKMDVFGLRLEELFIGFVQDAESEDVSK